MRVRRNGRTSGGRPQRGAVLVFGLLILLALTTLGVSALLDSGLRERMVGRQKQTIAAGLAVEAGAAQALQWARAHPEAWGDAPVWQAGDGLPFAVPAAPNLNGGGVYWIESVRFEGDTAVIVSRGGVWTAGGILGEGAVVVMLQNADERASAGREAGWQQGRAVERGDQVESGGSLRAWGEAGSGRVAGEQKAGIKVVAWKLRAATGQ